MIIDGTNGLTFNNATTQASAGSVLQVVSATSGTQVSTTSTSPVTTGLAASITPKFSTSKILVLFNFKLARGLSGADGSMGGTVRIYRGASSVFTPSAFLGFSYPVSTASYLMAAGNYLDSPATTSSTTYTIYFNTTTAGAQITYTTDGDSGSITLMEIAA
jgi:hypothetical protein